MAITECEGRVCSGSQDGKIRVWSMMEGAHEPERTLEPHCGVYSLSVWEDRLISGHRNGQVRVWCVVTGTCDQVLEAHTDIVTALAVCGSRLASGSRDKSIKLWAMGAAGRYCERTLQGHSGVWSLVGWQGKVVSGWQSKLIRVWDAATGAKDATLPGHNGTVLGLTVHGDRLFSASKDRTIRVWACGTWAALRTVEVHGRGTDQYPRCLAVSGSQLVSGSVAVGCKGLRGEVRVWSLGSLDLLRSLPQPFGADVRALLAVERGVWAGVGRDVVVWGRRGA
jgi:WD40 repeat protein